MSRKELLDDWFVSIQTDARFTEAAVTLRDGSVLYFCHRVGERWAKAVGPDGEVGGQAEELLDALQMFRLNAKHLDLRFDDGSRWERIPDGARSVTDGEEWPRAGRSKRGLDTMS